MFGTSRQVAFTGVGHSEIGRRLERPLGLLALDACLAAVTDAGLTLDEVDGIATFPNLPTRGHFEASDGVHIVSTEWMIRTLGLTGLTYWNHVGAGGIGMAVGNAIQAVATGACDTVLVFRALHLPRQGGYSQFTGTRAKGPAAYAAPYGSSLAPISFAFSYMRYQKLYGATREHMAAYVLAARRGANRNPYAYFRNKTLSLEEYLDSRMIADPLCLYDCDLPVDGAAAMVITTAERAKDLPVRPAYVTGLGQAGWNPFAPIQYDDLVHSARTLGRELWRTSGLGPRDIDAAMLYDGYAPDVYLWLEGLGFCGEGEAYSWIQDGRIELGGELPVNTFGGNLSEGRLHGIGHFVEATLQIQGRANERQVAHARHVVVTSGMTAHGTGVVLSSEPS